MPTYSYACKDCGHAFDIVQSFSDDALTVCPECGGNLRKQFNSVGVVFKGSGFYRNDSRDTGAKKSDAAASETKSDTGETKKADKPAESKSAVESKPAATSTPASTPAKTSGGSAA